MNRRLFLLTALALSGCATAAPRTAPPVVAAQPPVSPPPRAPTVLGELESVYSAQARRDGLVIAVASNGCTSKGDFAFFIDRRSGAVALAFARKRVDTCRAVAMGKADLSFSWDELGLAPQTPVFLLNPVVAWTGPGG